MENCEEKHRKSCHSTCVTNLKDPKQLKKYVEETMESDSCDLRADEENTVLPNYFYFFKFSAIFKLIFMY